jgi:hypothetical protein
MSLHCYHEPSANAAIISADTAGSQLGSAATLANSATIPANTAGGQFGSATCISSSTSTVDTSTAIAVVVGIGATLGIALVAMIIMFCRERKRNARLQDIKGSLSGIDPSNRNSLRNTLKSHKSWAAQNVLELRGDMVGYELPRGSIHELGGAGAI